ncbi:MAG: hypothetical protein CHACPFDD_01604 [Phycisphaerae bacterium]|nr:hypothetical protein [Phycisphaerae bacterium]
MVVSAAAPATGQWCGDWRTIEATEPGERIWSQMVYCPAWDHVLLFSGYIRPGSHSGYDELWRWDSVWEQLPSSGRLGSEVSMSFDTRRNVAVAFGSYDSWPEAGNTWEWDGEAWRRVATTGPGRRHRCATAYDSTRGVVVLFGGVDGTTNQPRFGDTWEWDGKGWLLRATGGPAPRSDHTLVYDSARRVCVLFGGESSTTMFGDTWEWDGVLWRQIVTPTSPTRRISHAMEYDPTRRISLMTGGYGPGAPYRADTWSYDGREWRLLDVHVQPRGDHAMTYNVQQDEFLVYGGYGSRSDPQPYIFSSLNLRQPRIVEDPSSAICCIGGSALFSVPADDEPDTTYQWRRDGVALVDDPRIQGAATPRLLIRDVATADGGEYDLLLANPCGEIVSLPAALVVREDACLPCDVNCDGSVNGFDIDDFVELLTDPAAPRCSPVAGDVNGDGALDAFDIELLVASVMQGAC